MPDTTGMTISKQVFNQCNDKLDLKMQPAFVASCACYMIGNHANLLLLIYTRPFQFPLNNYGIGLEINIQ